MYAVQPKVRSSKLVYGNSTKITSRIVQLWKIFHLWTKSLPTALLYALNKFMRVAFADSITTLLR